jgi:acetate kinase
MKTNASGMHALGTASSRVVLTLNRRADIVRYAVFSCRAHREEALLRGETQAIDDGAVLRDVLAQLRDKKAPAPTAVGHRLLYGGTADTAHTLIDDASFSSLAEQVSCAPMQSGVELGLVHAARAMMPDVAHVAVFDNAFHSSLGETAFTYALPDELRALGVRRYGFHGLAYEHAVDAVGADALGRSLLFHLGGASASIAAVRNGACVDTTMGFTPLSGIVMGARPGDLDPGVVLYLLRSGYEPRALERMFSERSGVRGIAGESDILAVVPRRARDRRSALAFDMFIRSAQKAAGALVTTLGGLDSIVFMGDVGENLHVRDEICHGLAHLGVTIDPSKNRAKLALGDGGTIISTEKSPITVRVLYADEERMIARHTYLAATPVTLESKESGERSRSSR